MISVIIPVYNAEQHLKELLQCLKLQTYQNFEVLLVNDGSTDTSAQICEAAAKTDSRFRCVHQSNQGVSAARNLGLTLSKGAYIAFLDADDRIPENYLAELRAALDKNDCSMSVCDVAVVDGNVETRRFTLPPQLLSQTETMNHLLTRNFINSGPCAKLFRREVLEGLQFPPLKAYEDILFVVEAVCQCNRIAVTNRTEYRYIQNTAGAMHAFVKTPSQDIVTASHALLDLIDERPELEPRCFYITLSHLMQYAMPLVQENTPQAKAFVRAVRKECAGQWNRILRCKAFPWKEKIVYVLFACGWLYHNKKFVKV